ncbi:MAG: hypothetical protein WAW11_02690 [Patescibacteria group bacterium]
MDHIISHPLFTKGLVLVDSTIHCLSHFQRVEKLGHIMAEENGADKNVISLFAYLHDARRHDDLDDIGHGHRASLLLKELIAAEAITLSDFQYDQLKIALACHELREATSDDVTIQTCWDADRLDLWRDGITPNPDLLFTKQGKSQHMINFAKELNFGV